MTVVMHITLSSVFCDRMFVHVYFDSIQILLQLVHKAPIDNKPSKA